MLILNSVHDLRSGDASQGWKLLNGMLHLLLGTWHVAVLLVAGKRSGLVVRSSRTIPLNSGQFRSELGILGSNSLNLAPGEIQVLLRSAEALL